MDYNIKEKDVVVRLAVEEVEIFRDNINLENFIIEEIADEVIYIYKSADENLTETDIEIIETELAKIEEIIEENQEDYCYEN
ncbi:hypothetical protein [uncultured Clostridium sp.]|uniref:hypothetical protein n=1 Tax=uncultured Clostridium sp. TaxID=59620 RepID=UPI002624613D|nr:hypothetical protein [uncultured Clostridium sp.]